MPSFLVLFVTQGDCDSVIRVLIVKGKEKDSNMAVWCWIVSMVMLFWGSVKIWGYKAGVQCSALSRFEENKFPPQVFSSEFPGISDGDKKKPLLISQN